ncbi:MAG: 4Fe-4S binding protein [Desulfovibrio sp.]|nr:4Fe-4S binding protein [Desulfovibrio sp.]
MCMGAGLALLLALLMGPVFCSWLCPYGFFSELAHAPGAKRACGTRLSRRASFAPKAACRLCRVAGRIPY